ncbi:MAG: spore protease YyaC [Eubacteriales bacterium]|nr:spore protease YyaC [Eubacteriales bacterium]
MSFYVDTKREDSCKEIARLLKSCILHHPGAWSELVFLCIGSDRMTGDCLGPYIGHQLSSRSIHGIFVYGTLQQPVHALNLSRISEAIRIRHPQGLVIAIDASLGEKKHLGYVTIGNGALYPGAGVRKKLPPVGDIHITGIVNMSGVLEQLTLQTTRLSTVIALGDTITQGILDVLPRERLTQRESLP